MKPNLPLGIEDFQELRQAELLYVDKTQLAMDIIDRPGTKVMLIPRPRRFGKTLNLSMLRYYFERSTEDRRALFAGLRVFSGEERYRAFHGRYPVISVSFKGIKQDSAAGAIGALKGQVQRAYDVHRALLDEPRALYAEERPRFQAILDGSADEFQFTTGLVSLCKYLQRQAGQPTLVLIDEYDEPLHSAYLHGYADQILPFYRSLLGETLKGNPHLWKGVMTGILRVARESIFSELNNLGVYSLLRPEFNTSFGFSEEEVLALLNRLGEPELLPSLRSWYNGYRFGGLTVYNPWSVMSYLDSSDRELRGYWTRTSSNDLVKAQLRKKVMLYQPALEELLAGGTIERLLPEDVALSQLDHREDLLWSLLVFTGYLNAEKGARPDPDGPQYYRLAIPNRELREVFVSTFREWLDELLHPGGGSLPALRSALFEGDEEALQALLQAFLTNVLSYHDLAGANEQVYQAFLTGLLASLEPTHQVRSNREAGAGRPDVQIFPNRAGGSGVALELKVARVGKKSPAKALDEALQQLRAMDYAAELRARGAAPIHAFAIALRGKQALVKLLQPAKPRRRPSR